MAIRTSNRHPSSHLLKDSQELQASVTSIPKSPQSLLFTQGRPQSSVTFSRKAISILSPPGHQSSFQTVGQTTSNKDAQKQFTSQSQQDSQNKKKNPLLIIRNMSQPSNFASNAKQFPQSTTANSKQGFTSTQTGVTLKSIDNLPVSSTQIQSQNQYSYNRLMSPQKSQQQYWSSLSDNRQQFQGDGPSQISDSYIQYDDGEEIQHGYQQQHNQEDNVISVEWIIKLYEARCKDIKLDIQFSQLVKFVDRIHQDCIHGKLNLQQLSLGKQSAKVLSQIINRYVQYTNLNLGRNDIQDEGVQNLAQILFNHNHISVLDISNNNLSPIGCEHIFQLLMQSESIYALNISSPNSFNRNKMNLSTAKILSQAISCNQILGFLDISHSQLGPQGLYQLAKGLKVNRGLISLNLAYNELGTDCGMLIGPSLLNSKLLELNLSHNKIGSDSLEKIGDIIRSGQGVFAIEVLNFSFNEIKSEGLSDFLGMMAKNQKIKKLFFDGNSFQDPVGESFTNFFSSNTSLTHFSVKNCSFHSDFVQELSVGLKQNESLQYLDLSHNYIGDAGATFLSDCLSKDNFVLKTLILSRCNIQEKGGVEIAKIIATHPKLESIDLSHNLINEQAGTYFVTNIRSNWKIISFDLEKNYIRYDQHIDIKKLVKRNIEFTKMKEPAQLLNDLSDLRISEIKTEDLDKRRNDLVNREINSQKLSSNINENIEYAENNLQNTEAIAREMNLQLKAEMDGMFKELKEQDLAQNFTLKDLEDDIEKQFDHNLQKKKEVESIRKEIKNKSSDMIQRKNLLKNQLAFQKRIQREEEQKAKSEEMAFQMFQSNVENLKKRIEILKTGKMPPESEPTKKFQGGDQKTLTTVSSKSNLNKSGEQINKQQKNNEKSKSPQKQISPNSLPTDASVEQQKEKPKETKKKQKEITKKK